jgi:hypothetical protein
VRAVTSGPSCSGSLISYVRGRITVLDRPALEERTCECYARSGATKTHKDTATDNFLSR